VEDSAAKVISAMLVDVAVSVVVDGGVFVIVLTGTVVSDPGVSEVGTGVVSPPFISGFAGVCTVVVVSGLPSVLLSAPNIEASELFADCTAVAVSTVVISGEDVVIVVAVIDGAMVSLLLAISLLAPLGTVALGSTFVTTPVSLCR